MQIQEHISLQPFNTFGIDAKAQYYANIESLSALKHILADKASSLPLFILGGGSNMLITKDIEALVLHINLKGITVVETTDDTVIVEAQAGENWHEFVLWCLNHDYGGVENLSLIPGNIGTAPIQNIGAYGVELKDVFVSCKALHVKTQTETVFTNAQCQFGYRESVFKRSLKDDYIITSVRLQLSRQHHKRHTAYGAIASQLATMKVKTPTIQDISKAVIAIRQQKLPDPKVIGNSGSFFKNPVINTKAFLRLKAAFPDVPHYTVSDTEVKVPAGWLIEIAGFKGKRFGNYGVHDKQALVLVNYGNASGKDIYQLAQLIQHTVLRLFNIHIETEVNIV